MRRASVCVALAANGWAATLLDTGQEIAGGDTIESCLETFIHERVDVYLPNASQLQDLLARLPANARPNASLIREKDAGMIFDVAGFQHTGGASWWCGDMLFPGPIGRYARKIGAESPDGLDAEPACRAWQALLRWQKSLLADITGVESSHTISGTAMKAALPLMWRRGADRKKTTVAFEVARRSYYGGRQQLFRPDYAGDAVYYDIKSAYGWAMTCPLPDWQTYDARPILPREPGWYDATVRLSGPVGPLPVRDPDNPRALSYPTDCTVRGWWTRLDIERSGVHVVEVHAQVAGRPSDDLRRHVAAWLDRRETSACLGTRDTIRALAVGFAGKLAQRDTAWALWHVAEGEPPVGSRPLSGGWWVYPTRAKRPPVTLPTTASYITAMVRARVWPTIANGDAIYTHTDSVHLPADVVLRGGGPDTGDRPGDWSIKAEGYGRYHGIGNYTINGKHYGSRGDE